MLSARVITAIVIAGLAVFLVFKLHGRYMKVQERNAYRQMQLSLAHAMLGADFRSPDQSLTMPYRLFVPAYHKQHPEARLPIILALHSGRGRGNDNIHQMDRTIAILLSPALQGIEPVFVLAPQADVDSSWVNYTTHTPPFRNFDQEAIPQSANLKTAIEVLRNVIDQFNIDTARVYITGISMGGEGTWDALTYYPGLFAAAIPINGAGDPEAVKRVGMLPIRFFHGSEDSITPVENSRQLNAALSKRPNNAVYRELPGAGHDIRDQVYTPSLFQWLLAQRRPEGEPSPAAQESR